MSHFTTVATKINDLVCLKRALDKLGLKYVEAEEGQSVSVRGWKGQTTQAALKIDMGKYDIGVVKQEDGTYTLVADWWGIEVSKGKTEQEVVEELNREYAYQRVVVACENQGYQIENQEVAADGTVTLSVSKWG